MASPQAASSLSTLASRSSAPTSPGSNASPAISAPRSKTSSCLRHLRARAIEGERSRISRDLHDGILQTLLSIEIQLDVLRRKVASSPDQAEASLGNLQQTVKNEAAELRRMVTDLRPSASRAPISSI